MGHGVGELGVTTDHTCQTCQGTGLEPYADGTPRHAPFGPVEGAYREWIHGLGRLSPRQRAVAEHVYALARAIDKGEAEDRPAAAMASLSRALSRAADTMPSDRPEQPAETPTAVDRPPTPDEVARKRADRRARRGAAS